MDCKYCDYSNDDLKRFTDHVKKLHNKSSEQYTIDVFHDGMKPTCLECGSDVRYVSYSFKRYCKDHARMAMSQGGALGGSADAWNKGKTKETDDRIAVAAEAMKGSGNSFFGKKHSKETIDRISATKTLSNIDIERRITDRSNEFELITPMSEYHSRQLQYLEFRCKKCGTEQPKTLQAFERGSRCYVCHPMSKSNWELEVFDYVSSKFPDARTGDRTVLAPKEIDVFVQQKSLGIECHGLYWHSEATGTDKRAHIQKLQMALDKNIRLVQLFYDEWRDHRVICESIIDHRLGIQKRRIGARSCDIVELNSAQQREFFDLSHIAGYTPATKCFALQLEGVTVAALSLRKPRQAKYESSYEIARFSTSPGTSVVGGLGRLLGTSRRWLNDYGIKSLMTYVDRRFGDGHGYLSCGFELVGDTGIDYWYTDGICRYDRFKFRASNGIPEVEVARQAKVSKIWGCGSLIMKINV